MTRQIAALIGMLAALGPAANAGDRSCEHVKNGPCYPSFEVSDPLNARFRDIMKEYGEFRDRKRTEENLMREALLHQDSILTLDMWHNAYKGLPADEARLRTELVDLLRDVAAAYHIPVSFDDMKPVVGGAFAKTKSQFEPKIAFEDFYVATKPTADHRSLTIVRDYRTENPGAAASTLPNGDVVFRASAFERAADEANPLGTLASLIHHEAVHFRELTTTGVKKKEPGEVLAYKEVQGFEDNVYFLSEAYKRNNADRLAMNEKKVRDDRHAKFRYMVGGLLTRFPGTGPDLLSDFQPTDPEWDAMAEKSKTIEAPLDEINRRRKILLKRLTEEKGGRGEYDRRVSAEFNARYGYNGPPAPSEASPSGCSPTRPCAPDTVSSQSPRYPQPPAPVVAAPAMPAQGIPAQPSLPAGRQGEGPRALADLASRACASPESVDQELFDRAWAKVYGVAIAGDSYRSFGLQGCAAAVYSELTRYNLGEGNGRLSVEWLRELASTRARPPAVSDENLRYAPKPQDRPRCRWAGDWCK